jgi:NAD(P)-dependent dehydrogenase (short-subunit alcohol dehydrogenase family)
VTGGNHGLGAAICERFAHEGALLFALARSASQLSADYPVTPIEADLTTLEGRQTACEALAALGEIDVFVNNAGMFLDGPVAGGEGDLAMMDLHLWAPMALIRASLPGLARRKGAIVNITSVNALKIQPAAGSYGISKAALEAATRCLAIELAPAGVRVNAVAPGPVPTALLTAAIAGEDPGYMLPYIPLGRLGRPQDIASAVYFLASGDATWITGQVLRVDGGMSVL